MTSAGGDIRNPSRMQLTPEQINESVRADYWDHAIRYGLQYYVAGRFAAASGFIPVTANLLHHAVELLLKACLARVDSLATIQQYGRSYRHDLHLLWTEFKSRHAADGLAEFDGVVAELHKFENIRYPETLVEGGARITMDLFDVPGSPECTRTDPGASYALSLPFVDRLMRVLFKASGANPEVYLAALKQESERARLYYPMIEGSLLGG